MAASMYAVIMAGGGGTRLWPLSRRARPKPFLPLLGDETLFQRTVARLAPLIEPTDVYVVADQRHLPLVTQQAPQIAGRRLLGEPFGRNTAAAVALAAIVGERSGDDVMVVLPADHLIADEEAFRALLAEAADAAADGSLVTLGISATGPETGYGYVVGGSGNGNIAGGDGSSVARSVDRFVEKPDRARALELLASPSGAWWNAGIFIWRRDAVLTGLERHAPAVVGAIRRGLDAGQSLSAIYEPCPISRSIARCSSPRRSRAGSGSCPQTSAGATWAAGTRSTMSSPGLMAQTIESWRLDTPKILVHATCWFIRRVAAWW